MKKSSLLNQASDENKLEIYQILTNNENKQFQIIYENTIDLPFHIERQSGHIYLDILVFSKYTFEYDKTFAFIVNEINRRNISFEITIQNDDPLIVYEDLRREFYIDDGLEANKLIGSIHLLDLLNVRKSLHARIVQLEFKLENNDVIPNRNLFFIDKHSGLIFTKSPMINLKQTKLFKLNVCVNGLIDNVKNVSFRAEIFLILREKLIINNQISIEKNRLQNTTFKFYSEQLGVQTFDLELKNQHLIKTQRFKIIEQNCECQINWYSSSLICNLNSTYSSSYDMKIIVYNLNNFDLTNLIHVQIYANRSWLQDTNLPQTIELERKIQINWSQYNEESVGFIYDMLNYDHNINVNPLTHQIQMIDDFKQFKLNPTSSELKLISNSQIEMFYLKFEILNFNQKIQIKFNVSLRLNLSFRQIFSKNFLQPYFTHSFLHLPLDFKTLLTADSKNMFKLGAVNANLYALEDLRQNTNLIDEQKSYLNYYLVDDTYENTLYINKTNGTLWVNLTQLIATSDIQIEFEVVAVVKHLNKDFGTRIKCKIRVQNAHQFDLIALKRGYFHENQLRLEKLLESANEEIFNLNKILFNSVKTPENIVFKLENTMMPFEIRSDTGQLVARIEDLNFNAKILRTYEFSIGITEHLSLNVRLILGKNSLTMHQDEHLTEIMVYSAPSSCPSSHFIGSLNNFFTQEQTIEYRFSFGDTSSNEILFLNESTGEFYCNRNVNLNESIARYDVEVYAKIENFKQFFFFKSIVIHFDFYESLNENSGEHLIYEIKLNEFTRIETQVWSMPYSVSLRYTRCSIIAGNLFNTFYLNKRGELILVNAFDYMLKSTFNLFIRCVGGGSELEIELNIELVKENFYSYVDYQSFLGFDTDIYEINVNLNRFENEKDLIILGKVNAFYYSKTLKRERIKYKFLDESSHWIGDIYLNESTGAISAKMTSLNEYCLNVNNVSLFKTIKAFNQVRLKSGYFFSINLTQESY